MFVGSYLRKLDSAGRVPLPGEFLEDMPERGLVVTRLSNPVLFCFSFPRWEVIESFLMSTRPGEELWKWRRLLIGSVQMFHADSQGRVELTPTLLEFAEIDRDILFVGRDNRFETWDPEIYRRAGESGDDWQLQDGM